jgi:hypothetical protein
MLLEMGQGTGEFIVVCKEKSASGQGLCGRNSEGLLRHGYSGVLGD